MCDWAGLGDRPLWLSAYSFAKIRNRERGRKWAEQEDIDKGGGGGTGESVNTIQRPEPVSPRSNVQAAAFT